MNDQIPATQFERPIRPKVRVVKPILDKLILGEDHVVSEIGLSWTYVLSGGYTEGFFEDFQSSDMNSMGDPYGSWDVVIIRRHRDPMGALTGYWQVNRVVNPQQGS
jgi:hypothetical protein